MAVGFDFDKEFTEIKSYIENQVWKASKSQKVKFLEVGYEAEQTGLIKVFLDYREDAKPDGIWTMHLDSDVLERSHWPQLFDEYEYEELISKIGELIKAVMFTIRAERTFNSLCKFPDCQFGIEELNGTYAWPNYKERGNENRV